MKPKLSQNATRLRKELRNVYERALPGANEQTIVWHLLRRLTYDHKLDPGLSSLLSDVIDKKSIKGYLDLQKSFGDPQQYGSPAEFYSAASVLSFLKKYPFGKVEGLDPLAAAEASSIRAEKLCRITNRRIRYYRFKGYRQKNRWQGLHSIFHTARLLIADLLGEVDLDKIHSYMRHGPGGAIGVTGSNTTAYFKYASTQYSVTTRALPYAEAAILSDPLWRRYVVNEDSVLGDPIPSVSESREAVLKRLKVVDHNKVTYVPKTAQTHRAIAIEPLMNIYLQLGIGDFFAECLRKQGVDLRSQARNQMLARDGSNWGGASWDRPVTLDLSMASDTLSLELVRELLPEDWFNLLDDVRSHYGIYKGKETHWAKFSSMGNGFTFQLESIIFFALSLSVAKHLGYARKSVAVYGDDIIVPAGMALRLIDVLAFSGFHINVEKSYLFGQFRESCGSDWFGGVHVRPFFLKRKIKSNKDLVFLYNSLKKYTDRTYDDNFIANLRSGNVLHKNLTCEYIYHLLPMVVKENLLGPPTEALEGHLHVPLDFASKSKLVHWDKHLQTWSYGSIVCQPRRKSGLAGPLYLQVMTHNSSGRCVFQEIFFLPHRQLLPMLKALDSAGTQSGTIVRRKDTRFVLATQTSNGWRND